MGQHSGDQVLGKQEVVVDASVAAKWYLEEEHSDKKARRLRDSFVPDSLSISVPALFSEALNALRYSIPLATGAPLKETIQDQTFLIRPPGGPSTNPATEPRSEKPCPRNHAHTAKAPESKYYLSEPRLRKTRT